jgi:prevent-host-death family protein
MQSIGIRELRQRASEVLRRVEGGETFQVTDRGRPLALLTPLPEASPLERLRAQGDVESATGSIGDLPPPLTLARGVTRPSAALARLRDHER